MILAPRVENLVRFATIYTAVYLLFDSIREGTCPTANLETEVSGTTMVTCSTGGCTEIICRRGSVAFGPYDEALAAIFKRKDRREER